MSYTIFEMPAEWVNKIYKSTAGLQYCGYDDFLFNDLKLSFLEYAELKNLKFDCYQKFQAYSQLFISSRSKNYYKKKFEIHNFFSEIDENILLNIEDNSSSDFELQNLIDDYENNFIKS